MDLSHPLADLLGENMARIIRRLGMVHTGLSGRRTADLAEVPVASASRALAKLEAIGLVHSEDVGPSRVYRLNRQHVLWNPLDIMVTTPAIIKQEITKIAARPEAAGTTVAIFGSFARGEASAGSDIDVVMVNGADDSEQSRFDVIDSLRERIREMTGNDVDILEIDDDQLARMAASHDPLLDSWITDGQTLAGPDLTDRIRQAR